VFWAVGEAGCVGLLGRRGVLGCWGGTHTVTPHVLGCWGGTHTVTPHASGSCMHPPTNHPPPPAATTATSIPTRQHQFRHALPLLLLLQRRGQRLPVAVRPRRPLPAGRPVAKALAQHAAARLDQGARPNGARQPSALRPKKKAGSPGCQGWVGVAVGGGGGGAPGQWEGEGERGWWDSREGAVVLSLHLSTASLSLLSRSLGRVPIAGWSLGGVGPDRGLSGGGRRGWCEEWARRG